MMTCTHDRVEGEARRRRERGGEAERRRVPGSDVPVVLSGSCRGGVYTLGGTGKAGETAI